MKPKTQAELDEVVGRYTNGRFLWIGQTADEALAGLQDCEEAWNANEWSSKQPFATR